MKQIDCRGLNCPIPVVKTKKALKEAGGKAVKVLLDNPNSLQNVKRFAASQGRAVEVQGSGDSFELTIKPGAGVETEEGSADSYVILITSETLGEGDNKLGSILMKSFLNTLWENDDPPVKILFLNSAVKLACEGSTMLDTLNLLYESGANIVSCGTCLAYYNITDKLSVGHAGNMYEIVEALLKTTKVINI